MMMKKAAAVADKEKSQTNAATLGRRTSTRKKDLTQVMTMTMTMTMKRRKVALGRRGASVELKRNVVSPGGKRQSKRSTGMDALLLDAQTELSMVECALSMGQSEHNAAVKDAQNGAQHASPYSLSTSTSPQ